jgi:hypothetical protein
MCAIDFGRLTTEEENNLFDHNTFRIGKWSVVTTK